MDTDKTNRSDKDCGTSQDGGNRDTEKYARIRLIRIRILIMGGMFVTSLVIAALVGFTASYSKHGLGILLGVFCGLFSMFLGMAIQWLRNCISMEQFARYLILLNDKRSMQKVCKAVSNTKKDYGVFDAVSARSVADRVANRIVSRYVDDLTNPRVRSGVLKEVDQIVDDEVSACSASVEEMREAIGEEMEE